MRHPAFLTVFLLAAGIFTLWCAIKSYRWFYTDKGLPGLFKNLVGLKLARVFYIIVGALTLTWGLELYSPFIGGPLRYLIMIGMNPSKERCWPQRRRM